MPQPDILIALLDWMLLAMFLRQNPLLLPVVISGLVLAVSGYDLITLNESYPLAPFTMYSYPFANNQHEKIDFKFFLNSDEQPFDNALIAPWDEVRLKTYLMNLVYQKDQDKINITLSELVKNGGPRRFNKIQVYLSRWNKITIENYKTPTEVILVGQAIK
jgi:hypothetical protein